MQQLNGSVDINFTDSREADPAYHSGTSAATSPLTNFSELEDVTSIRTALKTFDAFTYSDANLDIMSMNDLIFAWRQCRGQQKSIADYIPAQTARTS